MNKKIMNTMNKISGNFLTAVHIIFFPVLLLLTVYFIKQQHNIAAIAGLIFVIIGIQVFYSIGSVSSHKPVSKLAAFMEPLIALAGLFFLIII
jgi:hypothetical protein